MKHIGFAGAGSNGGRTGPLTAGMRAALAGGTAMVVLMAAVDAALAAQPLQLAAAKQLQLPAAKRAQHAQRPQHPQQPKQVKKEPPQKPPQKPLQVPLIAISIANQRLTLYDNGVPIAHAPVSTGVPGHPTPMGIFSVIQKEIFHRSNIYSGAPMPFMQRITWSGVAMHAGVLPGYPASHGCIRMPHEFAVKLYGLTRTGARVIITRNEITPVQFEHGRLFVLNKPEPAKIGGTSEPKRGAENAHADWIRTAEGEASVMSDAIAGVAHTLAGISKQKAAESAEPPKAIEVSPLEVRPVESNPVEANPVEANPTEPKAVEPNAAEAAPAEHNPIVTVAPAEIGAPAAAAAAAAEEAAPPQIDTAATVEPSKEAAKDAETPTGTVLVTPVPVAAPQPIEIPKTFEPPSEPPKAAPATDTALEPFGPPRPLRPGPITVFVSKKEGKVFVRKAFQPLFDAPVTIARPNLPLGTHLFTAVEPKSDGASFRWLAVTLPAEAKKVEVRDHNTSKTFKPAKVSMPEVLPPPQTAAQALERIEMPPEAVAQISALMSAGASLIISDQGLGPETGLETDFIVLTR